MNTYDTVKIMSDYKYFLNPICTFNTTFNPNNGKEKGIYFCSKDSNRIPYYIFIALNYYKHTLTLEFSSKVLLDDYPKLISKDTIYQCLGNINDLDICKLDIDGILSNGWFTKLHATKDIPVTPTAELWETLNSNVNNFRRFSIDRYESDGINFHSDVKNRRDREYIRMYNKSKELTVTAQNKRFLALLDNPQAVVNYFDGRMRIEAEFNNTKKIKQAYDVDNTYLDTIFNSPTNPLLHQFDKVFDVSKSVIPAEIKTKSDWDIYNALIRFEGNLKLIEQEIRPFYNSRGGKKKYMNRVQELAPLVNNPKANTMVSEIRNLLIN